VAVSVHTVVHIMRLKVEDHKSLLLTLSCITVQWRSHLVCLYFNSNRSKQKITVVTSRVIDTNCSILSLVTSGDSEHSLFCLQETLVSGNLMEV
jgi:hypothetical protein